MAVVMFSAVAVACWPQRGLSQKLFVGSRSRTRKPLEISNQIWLGLVPVGLLIVPFDPFSGSLLAVCGPVAWWFACRGKAQALYRARRDALPETLDLISIAVASGLTVASAIELVSEEGPNPVRAAFASILSRSDSGMPLARALPPMSDELGESYHQLVVAFVSSVRDGAPLGDLLNRLGDHSRVSRRRRAEERSRRLTVLMLFPLAACSMPAVLIGTAVPVVVVAIRSLSL